MMGKQVRTQRRGGREGGQTTHTGVSPVEVDNCCIFNFLPMVQLQPSPPLSNCLFISNHNSVSITYIHQNNIITQFSRKFIVWGEFPVHTCKTLPPITMSVCIITGLISHLIHKSHVHIIRQGVHLYHLLGPQNKLPTCIHEKVVQTQILCKRYTYRVIRIVDHFLYTRNAQQ